MSPVVILYLHASVALPLEEYFPGDILRASLCDQVLWRACIVPSHTFLRPRPILPALPPTFSSFIQGEAQRRPSSMYLFPDSTEEAWS